MKLAFSILGREFSFGSAKAVSPELSSWLRGEDGSEDSQGAKLSHPYSQSAWVYIAISRIAEKIASLPFRISTMEEATARRVRSLRGSSDPKARAFCRREMCDDILESGAVVDLFNRPHATMSRQLFWEMIVTWGCLRGEFFVLPLDSGDNTVDLNTANPRIEGLLTLPPEMFWHIVSGYELSGWRYTGSPLMSPLPSEVLLPSEVIHSRNPNPYLYWRGMSPLAVAAVAAGADYAASKYSQGYWLNNADTGVIVTTDQQVTPEQRLAILSALRERKRKAGTADRPLFLWGGAKVEKPQLTGMEQQFIENRKMNRQEIGAIYKVPDAIMGFSASTALSGGDAKKSEEQSWIENTIAPLCCQLEAALDPIVKKFGPGLCGWFDVDSLPVMQEARRTRLDTAVKAFAIGVPINDANQVYDLGLPEYPWGNKSFIPFSLQEIGANGLDSELPSEDDPEETTDTEENPIAEMASFLGKIKNQKSKIHNPDTAVLWASHIASRRKSVKLISSKVTKVLHAFRTTTLAALDQFQLGKGGAGHSVPAVGQRSLVDLIFDPNAFGSRLIAEITNPITATLQLAGNELRAELGLDDPWQMPPRKALDYIAGRSGPLQKVGSTVRGQLNTALQEGLDAGESTSELADRLRSKFTDLSKGEALRIAQTEVNMAYNDARHVSMEDAGIQYKAWLSSHGPHVRPAHAAAEQAYINDPIPLDEPFEVDGESLMYPGDDSLGASAGNIINCQCIQLAAEKTAEDAKLTTYKIHGVGEVKFPKVGRATPCAPPHQCNP